MRFVFSFFKSMACLSRDSTENRRLRVLYVVDAQALGDAKIEDPFVITNLLGDTVRS